MDREKVCMELQEIFRSVFDDKTLIISEKTTMEDVPRWDSFENANLMVAIESKYNVRFNLSYAYEIESVEEILTALEERLKD